MSTQHRRQKLIDRAESNGKLFSVMQISAVRSWAVLCVLCVSMVRPGSAATFYVDGWLGDNGYDGLAATALSSGHGPMRNISQAIAAASDGDTIVAAPGCYQETLWEAGSKSLTITGPGTVVITGSDPVTTSSAGDGLPDAWVAAQGLSPFDPGVVSLASSLPWANGTNNLAAYQISLIPPTITATITPTPNAAGWNNTNVVVHFSASSAGSGIAWVTADIPVTGATNDCEVTGYAMDNAGNFVSASVFVNIDPTPPVITLDPGNGQSLDQSHPLLLINYADSDTNAPPQIVSAGLDLSTLQIMLDSSDVTTSFYTFASGAVGNGGSLAAGTHIWSATIADMAGNVTSTSVTFTATGAPNTNAPVMSNLDLIEDVMTVLPDMAEVWVQGKVTGDGTTVAAAINGGAPIAMNRRGVDFGRLLPLAPGTNVIVLVASDASGQNLSSKVFLVDRSTRYRAALTSPEFGAFMEGQAPLVSGYVSAKRDEGLETEEPLDSVTVNGVATTLDWDHIDANGNVPFTTVAPVPLPADGSPLALTLQIVWPSTNTVTLGYLEGYRVVEKQITHNRRGGGSSTATLWASWPCTDPCSWDVLYAKGEIQYSFAVTNTPDHLSILSASEYSADPLVQSSEVVSSVTWSTNCAEYFGDCPWLTYYPAGPIWPFGDSFTDCGFPSDPWAMRFGTFTKHYYHIMDTNLVSYGAFVYPTWFDDTTTMKYVVPIHYVLPKTVILTFEGAGYGCAPGVAMNLSNVQYKGQSPFAADNVAGTVSYLVTWTTATNELKRSDFTWPAGYAGVTNDCGADLENGYTDVYTVEAANWFGFSGFENQGSAGNVSNVTFSGPAKYAVVKDNGDPYPTPHWHDGDGDGKATPEDGKNWNSPVCYKRKTAMAVAADFTLNTSLTGTLTVEATTDPNIGSFTFTGPVNGKTFSVSPAQQITAQLPDKIKFYNPLKIHWKVTKDNAPLLDADTEHIVYVTLGTPTPNPLYETLLYIGCDSAKETGAGTTPTAGEIQAIIYKIWKPFKDRDVHRVDEDHAIKRNGGKLMQYWCDATDLAMHDKINDFNTYRCWDFTFMIKPVNPHPEVDGIGTCQAWADLFVNVLTSQGITGVQTAPITLPSGYGANAQMLVKTYTHPSSPGVTITVNESSVTACPDRYLSTTVIDAAGVPAQGGLTNPWSVFGNHAIVRVGNHTYYDPSYGTGPFTGANTQAAAMDWEEKSLDGFVGPSISCSLPQATYPAVIRKDPTVQQTYFDGAYPP